MLLLMFSYMTYRIHCDVGTGFVTFAGGAQNLSVTFCHVALLANVTVYQDLHISVKTEAPADQLAHFTHSQMQSTPDNRPRVNASTGAQLTPVLDEVITFGYLQNFFDDVQAQLDTEDVAVHARRKLKRDQLYRVATQIVKKDRTLDETVDPDVSYVFQQLLVDEYKALQHYRGGM
jgi:hypothetical protein